MKVPQSNFGKAFGLFLVIVFVMVITQSFVTPRLQDFEPPVSEECLGTPIVVDYPYEGGFLDPHACASQCTDQEQHYILYANGQATQCQILPGCLDWGEDRGVTCTIPGQEPSSEATL